ncbi:MAG: hypothetical protein VXX95_06760 [Candidatus Thermoplasmatota archaeon]|nr:hypothetical protein [Candidatus Thermoplasmatota archaeon]MEC7152145.1 hypothetical protein [Candidatus Thermoplasmatota archaeon]MEC7279846.1 hypothetical protein [Candidatus Thermoplasmatota archaeon]MEC7411619.1 hypothetical protein [Candidatus Thermoplasmatota archaeon]MEC7723482.1 hypothetical protein [Candidatus Thermoplasmatota archaeon]
MEQPYTFLGFEIPQLTQIVGGALVLEGVGFYVGTGMEHTTSLIPGFIGLPLLLLGIMAGRMPERRKLLMHIAVTFGLICALGGLMGISSLVQGDMGGSTYAQLIMLVVGSVYTFACVQSFIHARKAREVA